MGVDNFELMDDFKVVTMSKCVEEMQCRGDITRVPDYSVIYCEVFVDWMVRKEDKSYQDMNKTNFGSLIANWRMKWRE